MIAYFLRKDLSVIAAYPDGGIPESHDHLAEPGSRLALFADTVRPEREETAAPMSDEPVPPEYGPESFAHLAAEGRAVLDEALKFGVKRECSRRMQALAGARSEKHLEHKIANANGTVTRLLKKAVLNGGIDDDETAELARIETFDTAFQALRQASDKIEKMDLLAIDITDDALWV